MEMWSLKNIVYKPQLQKGTGLKRYRKFLNFKALNFRVRDLDADAKKTYFFLFNL